MNNVFCDQLSLLTTSMGSLSIHTQNDSRPQGTKNAVGTSDPKVSFVFAQQQPTAVTSSHSSSAPLKEKQVEKQSSCSSQTAESVDNCRIWKDLQHADAETLFQNGNRFLDERQGSINPQLAFQCYSQAARLHHSPSMTALGRIWEQGIGREIDFEKAFYWYLQAAQCSIHPDPLAMLKVAYYQARGIGTPASRENAKMWYERLAISGNRVGILKRVPVGPMGLHVNGDFNKVVSICENAIKKGSLRAQGLLGCTYLMRRQNIRLLKEGIQLLQKSAESGDPLAMGLLGTYYRLGIQGIPANPHLAKMWFSRAIEFGKSEIVPTIADMSEYDASLSTAKKVDFTAADKKWEGITTSLDILEEIFAAFGEATMGSTKAIVKLGEMFHQGTVVPQDTSCAEKLFQIAADRGDLFALCYLGKRGMVRLQKLSHEGNQVATFSLALAFARGIGCEKNENEARRLFLQLLSHCKLLLLGHLSSKNTPSKEMKDLVQIKELLKKEIDDGRLFQKGFPEELMHVMYHMLLAFEGQAHAIHFLGVAFEKGEGVPQDVSFAAKLYEKASELKDSNAMIHLASLYEHGNGVPQDISKAIFYLNKACDLENPCAMNILGNMYEFGIGLKVDEVHAAKLYRRSVDKKHLSTDGMINLGVMYAEGRGVLKDFKMAKMLLKAAVRRHDPIAMYTLAMLLLREGNIAKKSQKILKLLQDSAKLGNSGAIYQLGCLYRDGLIVEKDTIQASEYFVHAASLGVPTAAQEFYKLYVH